MWIKLSAKQRIHMKYQALFSLKNLKQEIRQMAISRLLEVFKKQS